MKWWKVKFINGKQFSILASSAYEAMTFAQTLAEEDGEGDLRVLSVEDEEVIMTGPIMVGDIPEVEYKTEVAEWKPAKSNNQERARFIKKKKRGLKT